MYPDRHDAPDDPPPFLGSWPRVYAAVLAYLAVVIALSAVAARMFR